MRIRAVSIRDRRGRLSPGRASGAEVEVLAHNFLKVKL